MVNKLTQSLVDYTFQTRYNATSQASQWLSGQLGDLRQQSEDLQAKVVELQKESGVYSLGTTDALGREQAYSRVLDQLQQATLAMNVAEQNRILKGAIAHAAESGDAEMLSGLARQYHGRQLAIDEQLPGADPEPARPGSHGAGGFAGVGGQGRPDYPKVAELRGNVAGLERSIHQEVDRIKGRAGSDYQVAVQTEAGTRRQYDEAKKQADSLNDKAVEFAIVSQEAQESRELYEDLLKRLKEAGVLEGLKSSNITVVDPGRTPAKPKLPNVPLYMAIALTGGFFFGCCGALLADTLDNKINSIAEVEELIGQALLGALPKFRFNGIEGISVLNEAHSVYAEALRAIRTALLLSQSEAPPKLLLVTSSIAGEGKSTLSVNLAVVLAQTGCHVLLVDADLRRGTNTDRLHLPNEHGLSTLLSGLTKNGICRPVAGMESLDVLVVLAAESLRAARLRCHAAALAAVERAVRFRGHRRHSGAAGHRFSRAQCLCGRNPARGAERQNGKGSIETELSASGARPASTMSASCSTALNGSDSGYSGYYGYGKDGSPYEAKIKREGSAHHA